MRGATLYRSLRGSTKIRPPSPAGHPSPRVFLSLPGEGAPRAGARESCLEALQGMGSLPVERVREVGVDRRSRWGRDVEAISVMDRVVEAGEVPVSLANVLLRLLRVHGGLTDDALQGAYFAAGHPEVSGQRLRTARASLVKRGLVRPAGAGVSALGNAATVWEVAR